MHSLSPSVLSPVQPGGGERERGEREGRERGEGGREGEREGEREGGREEKTLLTQLYSHFFPYKNVLAMTLVANLANFRLDCY